MHSAQCLGPWPPLMVSLPRLTRLNSSITFKMTMAMKHHATGRQRLHNGCKCSPASTYWITQTFAELAEKAFCSLPKAKTVHFVTDTYKEDSIKSIERKRSGESEAFLVKGPSAGLPWDWKAFQQNNVNTKAFMSTEPNAWKHCMII